MMNVLITGATGNLGRVAVEKFVSENHRVFATVNAGKANPLKMNDRVISIEADLTNEANVELAIQHTVLQYQTIDAALLLVGGFETGNFSNTDISGIRNMIALNFETAYNVARPVFNQMTQQPEGGRIVLIGAKPALTVAAGKNAIAYTLSKSLIFKLAELLNAEGKTKKVVTSVIVPSTMDTPVNRAAMPTANFSDWVTPEEIVDAMVYLTSAQGRAIREGIIKIYGNS